MKLKVFVPDVIKSALLLLKVFFSHLTLQLIVLMESSGALTALGCSRSRRTEKKDGFLCHCSKWTVQGNLLCAAYGVVSQEFLGRSLPFGMCRVQLLVKKQFCNGCFWIHYRVQHWHKTIEFKDNEFKIQQYHNMQHYEYINKDILRDMTM